MSETIIGPATKHVFSVDRYSRVEARDVLGGKVESQTVEALLLLEILHALRALNLPSQQSQDKP